MVKTARKAKKTGDRITRKAFEIQAATPTFGQEVAGTRRPVITGGTAFAVALWISWHRHGGAWRTLFTVHAHRLCTPGHHVRLV